MPFLSGVDGVDVYSVWLYVRMVMIMAAASSTVETHMTFGGSFLIGPRLSTSKSARKQWSTLKNMFRRAILRFEVKDYCGEMITSLI